MPRDRNADRGEIEALPWFQAAFGALYPIVYAHRDDASADGEADFAGDVLGIASGESVLDLACGDGRHLAAFARRGFRAIGVDLSSVLLARARGRGLVVARADVRALPFAAASFDHATCFFTSFGYFETDDENTQVLREAARVLRPRGKFLLDVPDRDALERTLVPSSDFQREGLRMRCERVIDGARVRKKVSISNGRGEEVARFVESVRIYALPELRAILEDAGFSVVREAGSFEGAPVGRGDRYLLASEKR
jgi:SAM-dependent methyltransferase